MNLSSVYPSFTSYFAASIFVYSKERARKLTPQTTFSNTSFTISVATLQSSAAAFQTSDVTTQGSNTILQLSGAAFESSNVTVQSSTVTPEGSNTTFESSNVILQSSGAAFQRSTVAPEGSGGAPEPCKYSKIIQ